MAGLENAQEAPNTELQEGQQGGAGQEQTQATEQPTSNLDDDPRFREWKSKMDKRLAQERAEREKLQKELAQHRAKMDELMLRDAPPEEREKYLRNKLTQLEEEQRLQSERQARATQAYQEAEDFLATLGLSADTPGLDWSGDPLQDGFRRLARSAAEIVAGRGTQTKEQVETQVRQARQQAAKETGAANVSTATGGSPALRAEYQKKLEALKGTGDFRGYAELKAQYRAKGLNV